MKKEQIQQTILDILSKIAPEIDPSTIGPTEPLQDAFEIDSMDFLRLVTDLDEIYSISIPERDYGKITTLDQMVVYITGKMETGIV